MSTNKLFDLVVDVVFLGTLLLILVASLYCHYHAVIERAAVLAGR